MNCLLKRVVVHRFIAMLDHKKVSIFIIWVPTCAIRAEPKTPPSAGLAAARVARPNQPGRFWWVNGVSRVEGFHPFPYWSNWISWLNYSILCPPGITHDFFQSKIDQIGRHGMDVYVYIHIYIYCIASCTFPPSSRHLPWFQQPQQTVEMLLDGGKK